MVQRNSWYQSQRTKQVTSKHVTGPVLLLQHARDPDVEQVDHDDDFCGTQPTAPFRVGLPCERAEVEEKAEQAKSISRMARGETMCAQVEPGRAVVGRGPG